MLKMGLKKMELVDLDFQSKKFHESEVKNSKQFNEFLSIPLFGMFFYEGDIFIKIIDKFPTGQGVKLGSDFTLPFEYDHEVQLIDITKIEFKRITKIED